MHGRHFDTSVWSLWRLIQQANLVYSWEISLMQGLESKCYECTKNIPYYLVCLGKMEQEKKENGWFIFYFYFFLIRTEPMSGLKSCRGCGRSPGQAQHHCLVSEVLLKSAVTQLVMVQWVIVEEPLVGWGKTYRGCTKTVLLRSSWLEWGEWVPGCCISARFQHYNQLLTAPSDESGQWPEPLDL